MHAQTSLSTSWRLNLVINFRCANYKSRIKNEHKDLISLIMTLEVKGVQILTGISLVLLYFRWLHEINQNCDEVSRVLVGNKCDDPDRRVVLKEDATRFAMQMGIQLFETSAKENINVEEMFRAITDLVLSSKKAQRESLDRPQGPNIRIGQNRPNGGTTKKKTSCCK